MVEPHPPKKPKKARVAEPDTLWVRMRNRYNVDFYCIVPFENAFMEACELKDTYVLNPDRRDSLLAMLREVIPRVEAWFEKVKAEELIARDEPAYLEEKAAQVRGMRTWIDTPHLTLDLWTAPKH